MTDNAPSQTPSESDPKSAAQKAEEFARASEESEPGLIAEFIQFLREDKAWWMTPLLLALIVLGFVAWLAGTALAPFIYPMF